LCASRAVAAADARSVRPQTNSFHCEVHTVRPLLYSILGGVLLSHAPANNGVDFVADHYYFELSYGDRMEFYVESHLVESPIANPHFRSILRVELPPEGYKSFKVPVRAEKATVTWNPAKTRVLAAFGEYAVILNPHFHILRVYRNMYGVRWVTNDDIVATVEVGEPTKYATGEFVLNVETERFRRLDKTKR
jgi:hypothetical protein